MKFLIDFEPGAHGHFLELVLNKYVFGVKYDGDDIFQSSGAAHKIRLNQDYQKNKFVGSGHFFWSNWSYPKLTEKVVVIKHDPNFHFVQIGRAHV